MPGGLPALGSTLAPAIPPTRVPAIPANTILRLRPLAGDGGYLGELSIRGSLDSHTEEVEE